MNGYLLVNKEKGMTSRDVVNIASRVLQTKKVGHTGTLDPIASGVLVLCIGKATKLVELVTSTEKEYVATVCLGVETDTLDETGTVLNEQETKITKEEIENALHAFQKTYMQEVPLYSAVKVKGRKCYEYARAKENVTLPKKEVTIYHLSLEGEPWYQDGKTYFQFRALVSKGTYIRSLIRDIALSLQTVGMMTDLVRTKQGVFKLEDCLSLEALERGDVQIQPMLDLVSHYPKKVVSEEERQKIKYGQFFSNSNNDEIVVMIDEHNNLLSIYQKYKKDETLLKPWKTFI